MTRSCGNIGYQAEGTLDVMYFSIRWALKCDRNTREGNILYNARTAHANHSTKSSPGVHAVLHAVPRCDAQPRE